MIVVDKNSGKAAEAAIELVTSGEFEKIGKSKFFFNWKTERHNEIYRLYLSETGATLGLVSLTAHQDGRLNINLLAVSRENRGRNKRYMHIAANIIAWTCREAIKRFGPDACVSLVPKTKLIPHYVREYGMMPAGNLLFLAEEPLLRLLQKYKA